MQHSPGDFLAHVLVHAAAKPVKVKATPTPFGVARAKEIWSQRGLMNDISRAVTPGEDQYVKAVWDTLPGNTCWMSAFHLIMQGKVHCYACDCTEIAGHRDRRPEGQSFVECACARHVEPGLEFIKP